MYGLSKKKMPYLHLIDEAIGLLNTEIRLIEWRIKYPEQLQQRINKQPLSPLYLADKTTLINIMEVVSGLFLSKDIVYQNGKPAYLVDLSKGGKSSVRCPLKPSDSIPLCPNNPAH